MRLDRTTPAWLVAAAAGALGCLACPTLARAGEGAAPSARVADEDEGARGASAEKDPGGPWISYARPPVLARETRACSMRLPICVHASGAARGRAVLDVIAAAERAWETLSGALRLAPPDVDPDDLAYHIYLVEGAAERAATRLSARDVRSRIDRARAFTVLDAGVRAGCPLDALVAQEIARAVLFRVAPATAEGVARAQTAYIAQLVVPCAIGLATEAAEAFQSRPERAVCDARAGEEGGATSPALRVDRSSAHDEREIAPASAAFADGAALFWGRIDWAYARTPGGVVMAAWALSPTRTEPGAKRWRDEPDAFDVLRESFKNALFTGSTLADLLLDTAVARAFMGSSDDGLHHVETRTLGDSARVPLEWDLPWPTRPKRVAPRAPVYPSGASYLVIRRSGAPAGARLRVEVAWEEHALFRWALVKLDARGRELGRIAIPTRERATEAQLTLVDLDAVDRVLLVGVNAGDPAYQFDPDEGVWEPHSWLVTLAAE